MVGGWKPGAVVRRPSKTNVSLLWRRRIGHQLSDRFEHLTQQNPAHLGEYLTVFCTGLGVTDPAALTGQPAATEASIKATIERQ